MGKNNRPKQYQERHRKEGLCIHCPLETEFGGAYCQRHRDANRARVRKKTGSKPWKPGGRGRPPLESKKNQKGIANEKEK